MELTLREDMTDFGDALMMECPDNDCAIYRNCYRIYCELCADYERIAGMDPRVHEVTAWALEREIRRYRQELRQMWFSNYAVRKQAAAYRRARIGGGAG